MDKDTVRRRHPANHERTLFIRIDRGVLSVGHINGHNGGIRIGPSPMKLIPVVGNGRHDTR